MSDQIEDTELRRLEDALCRLGESMKGHKNDRQHQIDVDVYNLILEEIRRRTGPVLTGDRRIIVLPFKLYREQAKDADILLWRPSSFWDIQGRTIAWGTDGPYKHASMVMLLFGRLWQAGYHMKGNGQLSPLSGEVRRFNRTIDVYRCSDMIPRARSEVAQAAVYSMGGDYQMKNIGLITAAFLAGGLGRIPFIKEWFKQIVQHQYRMRSGAICSQDVHRAFRTAGKVELCPGFDEPLVSPNDISRSKFVQYLGTLTWPDNWVQ